MKKYLNYTISLTILIFVFDGCSNTISNNDDNNTSWVFIANEGIYGESNGSISMIDEFGNIYETEALGDVVQSLEVYQDKLIVQTF